MNSDNELIKNQLTKNFYKSLKRPKSLARSIFDLVFAPLRMVLPDSIIEKIGLTSLRAERMGTVLYNMQGRCLDIGCNDNLLIKLYKSMNEKSAICNESVGVDVFDWNGDGIIIKSSAEIPFADENFDTITILASLNHIPEREDALKEALRLLKPGGHLVITMISPFVGGISHRVRFWGEHSHREVQDGETFGMQKKNVLELLDKAGFRHIQTQGFIYGWNTLYIAKK